MYHLPHQSKLQQLFPVTRAHVCYCPSISTNRHWLPLWWAWEAMDTQIVGSSLAANLDGSSFLKKETRHQLLGLSLGH